MAATRRMLQPTSMSFLAYLALKVPYIALKVSYLCVSITSGTLNNVMADKRNGKAQREHTCWAHSNSEFILVS